MNRTLRGPQKPEGHRSLGYCGDGNYRCGCGQLFRTGGAGPLLAGDPDQDQRSIPSISALHDQWEAHLTEIDSNWRNSES